AGLEQTPRQRRDDGDRGRGDQDARPGPREACGVTRAGGVTGTGDQLGVGLDAVGGAPVVLAEQRLEVVTHGPLPPPTVPAAARAAPRPRRRPLPGPPRVPEPPRVPLRGRVAPVAHHAPAPLLAGGRRQDVAEGRPPAVVRLPYAREPLHVTGPADQDVGP